MSRPISVRDILLGSLGIVGVIVVLVIIGALFASVEDADDATDVVEKPEPALTVTSLTPQPTEFIALGVEGAMKVLEKYGSEASDLPSAESSTTPIEVLDWSVKAGESVLSLGKRFNFDFVQEVVFTTEGAIYGKRGEWVIDEREIAGVCDLIAARSGTVIELESLIWDTLTWPQIAIAGALHSGSRQDAESTVEFCADMRFAHLETYTTPPDLDPANMTEEEMRNDPCFMGIDSSGWAMWDVECQRRKSR